MIWYEAIDVLTAAHLLHKAAERREADTIWYNTCYYIKTTLDYIYIILWVAAKRSRARGVELWRFCREGGEPPRESRLSRAPSARRLQEDACGVSASPIRWSPFPGSPERGRPALRFLFLFGSRFLEAYKVFPFVRDFLLKQGSLSQ